MEHLPAQDIDETALYDLLTRLEFKNFIKRFDLSGESVSAPRLPELKTERVENVLEAFNLMDSLTDCDRVYAHRAGNLRRSLPAGRRHGAHPVRGGVR